MDYKRIYKIAAKIILSKTMTESEWKKYHEEHPHAKRENHIIIPSSTSISQENKNKRHKRKDNARNREVRRLLRTLRLHIEKKYNKLQERIHSGHEFIVPNNIRSADNGIEDAKKHIKEI